MFGRKKGLKKFMSRRRALIGNIASVVTAAVVIGGVYRRMKHRKARRMGILGRLA